MFGFGGCSTGNGSKSGPDQKRISEILGSTMHPVSQNGPLQTYLEMRVASSKKNPKKCSKNQKP